MNLTKRTNLIGIILLLSFTAVAARIYFANPTRLSSAQPVVTATESYVCPMHPEVVSAQPGKCPQCGMALVSASKAKASLAGCGSETGGGCCGGAVMSVNEIKLPPGHPPVPGYNPPAGCDHSSGAVTNESK